MDHSQLQGFLTLKAMSFIPIKIRFMSLTGNKQLLNVLLPHLAFVNGPTAAEQPEKAVDILLLYYWSQAFEKIVRKNKFYKKEKKHHEKQWGFPYKLS